MDAKILILEDDREIGELLKKYLDSEGYESLLVHSGYQAAGHLQNQDFDLALLDIMLPDWNGYDLLKSIRQDKNLPVIFITAKDREEDKIRGLEIGADDYITKPFSIKEVLARVKALLRRYQSFKNQEPKRQIIEFPHLQIDLISYEVVAYNKHVRLTENEFKLLTTLALSPEQVFTKEQLARAVWPDMDFVEDNTIMVTMGRLRKKLQAGSHKSGKSDKTDKNETPGFIQTLWGIGYKFHVEK